jgi:hypothetical protein
MINDDKGAFSIDFVAAYSVLAILILCAFFTATNIVSVRYTASYVGDIDQLTENVGDTLLKSAGEPSDWYIDPGTAQGVTRMGLSGGSPNIITEERIQGLSFFNPPTLKSALGLSDSSGMYGLRLEIASEDGMVHKSAGYPLPPDTKDVCKSVRAAAIEELDGTYRSASVTVYMWRKDVGTASADE